MPGVEFTVADATDLRSLYDDRSVDVVAQDFLLNCAPHPTHLPIMREVGRILKPNGLGLISFTDNRCLTGTEHITHDEFRGQYGISPNEEAFSLADLIPGADEALRQRLVREVGGRALVNGRADRQTLITTAEGNFEFFRPYGSFRDTFQEAGLRIVGEEVSSGTDRNGITCVRYRTIVQPRWTR